MCHVVITWLSAILPISLFSAKKSDLDCYNVNTGIPTIYTNFDIYPTPLHYSSIRSWELHYNPTNIILLKQVSICITYQERNYQNISVIECHPSLHLVTRQRYHLHGCSIFQNCTGSINCAICKQNGSPWTTCLLVPERDGESGDYAAACGEKTIRKHQMRQFNVTTVSVETGGQFLDLIGSVEHNVFGNTTTTVWRWILGIAIHRMICNALYKRKTTGSGCSKGW